jgi:hypothetical protein
MNEIALIRPEPPGDEHGLTAIRDGIARLQSELGTFTFSHGDKISGSANQYVWFGPSTGDEIAVVDDFALPVRYVAARASSDRRLARLAQALRAVVEHVPMTELRARADAHAHDDPATLVRLALSLSAVDDEAKRIFARALASPSQPLRRHALLAAALLRWPALLPDLQSLAASETDEAMLRLAHHAVQVSSDPENPLSR